MIRWRVLPVVAIPFLLYAASRHRPGDVPARIAIDQVISAPTPLFPNAPRSPEWQTYADYRWGEKPGGDGGYDRIPFWREPTYDLDNGSHVVDYGTDAGEGQGPAAVAGAAVASPGHRQRPGRRQGAGGPLSRRISRRFRTGSHLPASTL